MFTLIFAIHAALCVGLIILVLIQQGKGADMGAAFGGGSNTLFGAGGAADFITKLTTGLAIAFMITSILLVRAYSSMAYSSAPSAEDPLRGSVMQTEPAAPAAKSDEAAPVAPPVAPPIEAPAKQVEPVQEAPAAAAAPPAKAEKAQNGNAQKDKKK